MVAELMTPLDRGLEQPRKPFRAEERAKKRRDHFILRIGRAKTPADKVAAAVDYLRAAMADHRVDPVEIVTQTDHVTHALINAADQLAKTVRRNR
jgi:hypothetical protein